MSATLQPLRALHKRRFSADSNPLCVVLLFTVYAATNTVAVFVVVVVIMEQTNNPLALLVQLEARGGDSCWWHMEFYREHGRLVLHSWHRTSGPTAETLVSSVVPLTATHRRGAAPGARRRLEPPCRRLETPCVVRLSSLSSRHANLALLVRLPQSNRRSVGT